LPAEKRQEGWRGVTLVAITYVYFLIFAQFAFLKRLAEIGIAGNYLKMVMGAMAAGGILASLLAPRIVGASAQRRLQIAFSACALAAAWLGGKASGGCHRI
jgi:cytochrome c oxidase cbb3-type subunit 2